MGETEIDFGEMMRRSMPSPEEMTRRRADHAADLKRRSALDLFCPMNLGHWIALAEAANVPHVPCEEIARVGTMEICSFETPDRTPLGGAFFETVYERMQELGPDHMVRWSCCTCAEVTWRLGNGEPEWHPDLVSSFAIEDLRAFDLVCEFPEDTIAAYARPWLKAAIIEKYPVEYRVFVQGNGISGISNYYPQRPLPNDAATLHDIVTAVTYTARMIRKQTKPLNVPLMEKHWDMSQNHFTADFIRSADGKLLFLEGGPPHTPDGGAHPCCFQIGETQGIAFAAAPEELAAMGLAVGDAA